MRTSQSGNGLFHARSVNRTGPARTCAPDFAHLPSALNFRAATAPVWNSKPFACIAFDGDLSYLVLRANRFASIDAGARASVNGLDALLADLVADHAADGRAAQRRQCVTADRRARRAAHARADCRIALPRGHAVACG
ncbi:hypothetical protein PCAR4_430003 [Paraburkholderia caribensis]|nr:hypothetical protein PCAR4_430003 [Paraburkholderia caribensis]